jgi:hypothetical protein
MHCKKSVAAHSRFEVRRIITLNNSEILTVGNDRYVRVWDSRTLNLKRARRLKSTYLVAATLMSIGIAVGLANGNLLLLNN